MFPLDQLDSFRLDPNLFEPEVKFTKWAQEGKVRQVIYFDGLDSVLLGFVVMLVQ